MQTTKFWHILAARPTRSSTPLWGCRATPQTPRQAEGSALDQALQLDEATALRPYSLRREAIVLVDSFDALDEMRQHVFSQPLEPK